MKKLLLLGAIFFCIDVIFFWNLWNTYFQQDEWLNIGRAIYQQQHLPWSVFSFNSVHFFPFNNLIWIGEYRLFGIDAHYYAFASILTHVIGAVCAYIFFKTLTKSTTAACILSTLLLISYPAKQVVVWYAVTGLVPAVSLVFLYLTYLIRHKDTSLSLKQFSVLGILFFVGMFFREEAAILIPLTFLYIVLFWRKENKKTVLKKTCYLLILMVVFILVRFFLEGINGENPVFEEGSRTIITAYNFLTVPPKMIIKAIS